MIEILGNFEAQRRLKELFSADSKAQFGGSLLLEGPKHVGKMLAASSYALEGLKNTSDASIALWETHPDLHIFKPQGKLALHTIESMKRLVKEATFPPTLAKFKVFIVQDAERLAEASANFLLKTLEEPPLDSLIILTTSKPEALLKTIRSRTETIPFYALDAEEICTWLEKAHAKRPEEAKRLALLAKGAPGLAHRYASERYEAHLLALASGLSRLFRGELSTIGKADFSSQLVGFIDSECTQVEKGLLAQLKEREEALSPFIKDQLQKQIEAEGSLLRAELTDELFELILIYARDLLISPGGAASLFPHIEPVKNSFIGELLPSRATQLLELENELIAAKRSLRYSIKLKTVLDALFLRLNPV